jgi:fluoroquinolone transport system permease protein
MKGMPGRISAALGRDLLVQYRAHYVSAAMAALAACGMALRFTPAASGYAPVAAFLLVNTFLVAFSLGVRQTLCERKAGILSALDLTPLRPHEFLTARCASLGLIAAIQNSLLTLAAGEPVASWASLLPGVGGEAVILSLVAFLVVAYAPAGRVAVASILASLLLLVPPLMPFLGFAPSAWLLVHPMQGPLLLIQGAFSPLPGGTLAAAMAASGIWMGCILMGCRIGYEKMRRITGNPAGSRGVLSTDSSDRPMKLSK